MKHQVLVARHVFNNLNVLLLIVHVLDYAYGVPDTRYLVTCVCVYISTNVLLLCNAKPNPTAINSLCTS